MKVPAPTAPTVIPAASKRRVALVRTKKVNATIATSTPKASPGNFKPGLIEWRNSAICVPSSLVRTLRQADSAPQKAGSPAFS